MDSRHASRTARPAAQAIAPIPPQHRTPQRARRPPGGSGARRCQRGASGASAPTPPARPAGDKFGPADRRTALRHVRNGIINQTGTIHWTNDAQHYEMVVSIPMPFVGPYVYSSKGHIDRFGIAPEQYFEQRGRRAADVTVFNRETKQARLHAHARQAATRRRRAGPVQRRHAAREPRARLARPYRPGVTRQFSVADNDSSETGRSRPSATKHPHTMAPSARGISRACRAATATGAVSTCGSRRRSAGCRCASSRPNRTACRSNCSGAASSSDPQPSEESGNAGDGVAQLAFPSACPTARKPSVGRRHARCVEVTDDSPGRAHQTRKALTPTGSPAIVETSSKALTRTNCCNRSRGCCV